MTSVFEPALDPAAVATLKRDFQTFLQSDDPDSKYSARITEMMESCKTRLQVSINELRDYNGGMCARLMASPLDYIPIFEAAVKEVVLYRDPSYFDKVAETTNAYVTPGHEKASRICVAFEGNFGVNSVTPRSLTAEFLGQMVAVEGIVTRCSLVRPKVVRSVHYCEKTKQFQAREYRDHTDMTGLPTGTSYPQEDDHGNRLETEFGLSVYKNSQTVTIQEMPESSPLGQLPRSVDCYLEHDLVDRVKPGDRITMVGMYRALSVTTAQATSGIFRTVILVNSVQRTSKETGVLQLSVGDVHNMRKLADTNDKNIFHLLARSLAPSIYGHKYVKQALALLLLGGVEHNLVNGTHIRGDINILMVGDPSTAKSQLLRFVLNIATVAVNTTGRGSSGVGLTAAVTTDPETHERRLEAGAMVLADRGVVCIDEFDKMSEQDRVAIHEVMEQQTVTIAKAGIQASLNARCSVVAAANPIYGRFDNTLPLSRNVALPDSLLSRFDLVFIVRDRIDEAIDSRLAGHVLRMHRYVRAGSEGIPVPLDATAMSEGVEDDRAEDADGDTPVYQKYNPLLHGGAAAEAAEDSGHTGRKVELLTMEFIRKYISYVKVRYNPKLTDEARAAIVEYYNDFRQRAKDRATLITARSLETLIRLSTAHARCRQKHEVGRIDVEVARDIMQFALYADAKVRKEEGMRSAGRGKRPGAASTGAPGGDDGNGGGGAGATPGGGNDPKTPGNSGNKRSRTSLGGDPTNTSGAVAGAKKGSDTRNKRSRVIDDEEEEEEEEKEEETAALEDTEQFAEEQLVRLERAAKNASASKNVRFQESKVQEEEAELDDEALFETPKASAAAPPDPKVLNRIVSQYFNLNDDGAATVQELYNEVKAKGGPATASLSAESFRAYLAGLEANNRVHIIDNIVHNIA